MLKKEYLLGGPKLTICVAGICFYSLQGENETREGIVFATDHMVSIEGLGQFEHKMKKYQMLSNGIFIMLSGDLTLDEITAGLDVSGMDFNSVAKTIQTKMKALRDEKVERGILNRVQLNMSDAKELIKQEINNELLGKMLKSVVEANLENDVLLIGFENGKAQLTIINEFAIRQFRELGFAAVGSGAIQALNTLLFQQHSKEEFVFHAIYNVYKAKKNAEVAEGVGKNTDLYLLHDDGTPQIITNLNILDKVYDAERLFGKTNKKILQVFGVPKEISKKEDGKVVKNDDEKQ